ncbi:MFS transporter [Paeniglutamicibacter sp.]|uniref:MFS transporter n=1 Tax=Paeniglutamicibacter sp. TaxID=1934391 RepID=UPI0039895739
MIETTHTSNEAPGTRRLPLGGLLALAAAGFITILLETLPAGILPAMGRDLGVTESAVGQTVTLFALGSIAGAIPIISATMSWPRRRLLVIAIAGYVVTTLLTAVSENFSFTLAIRFLAGIFAGVLWGMLAAYAQRMVAPGHEGRAITIALAGTPVALSVGTPAGTFLAELIGWRSTFGVLSVLSALLIIWILVAVPNFAGQQKGQRTSVGRVFSIPGVLPIIVVTFLYVMAHNVLYTYIASFLAPLGLGNSVSAVLLVFGAASLSSIWITGVFIDRMLRLLLTASCALFGVAVLALGLFGSQPAAVFVGAALWGLAFGGAASLLQVSAVKAAGAAADLVQPIMVTSWNIGIAGGGILGGLLLGGGSGGAGTLPWATFVLVLAALMVMAFAGRRNQSA